MLQYPINVKPENYAIDASKNNRVSFDFKGDFLSGVHYVFRDYDTDEVVHDSFYYNEGYTPIVYNGGGLNLPTTILPANTLTNGRNYTLQMMLAQRTQDGTAPLYDMPVLSGAIEIGESGQTQILIANDITSIYEWGESDGAYYPTKIGDDIFGGMVIKIGNETREILKYEPSVYSLAQGRYYGRLTLNSAFSGVTTGKPYQIYSNYLITAQYYFTCRSTPSVSFTHTCYSNRIWCKGSYSQSDNSLIKYYIVRLYWSNNASFLEHEDVGEKVELVRETKKIFSNNIECEFWYPYRHDEKYAHGTTDYYKIVCELVTQDNMVYASDGYVFSLAPEDYSDVIGNRLYSFKLDWDKELGCILYKLRGYNTTGSPTVLGEYELFRENLESGEVVQLEPHFGYIEDDGVTVVGRDHTASTHGNYRYSLKEFDDDGKIVIPVVDAEYDGMGTFPCNDIKTDECAYYITELNLNSEFTGHPQIWIKDAQYAIGDTWKFICDIEDTTITNNLDRQTHVGYNQYITSTSTNVNYLSGALSAMIGTLTCSTKEYTDTITLVNAWRKFITQEKPFLLKSQKGDVLVVNVVDNPTTEYQEDYYKIPTRFAFSWAEYCNVNDIDILS